MTYKDHGEIALIFRKHLDEALDTEGGWRSHEAISGVLDDVADYCYQDNPKFDRDKFMIATGIGIV